MMKVEFYFDFSCPYAYIGSTQIERVVAAAGAQLIWRPMLLGGVFRSIGAGDGPMPGLPAPKAHHNALDMMRWAELYEAPLSIPSAHPMRTVAALRALLRVDEAHWPAVIHGFFRAYWQRAEDPSAPHTVRSVLAEAGVVADAIDVAIAANDDPTVKAALRTRTDEAVARGIFGAPAVFISGGDISEDEPLMFWGQDRLHMIEAALAGWRPGPGASAEAPEPPSSSVMSISAQASASSNSGGRSIEFWYDFSSPFSYLGATQIAALAERTGSALAWRPMLLGAVFKQVGTPNVPMFAVSEAKRRYYARELDYWSSYWQVPFRFTSRFPMKTVSALRLALLAGDKIGELSAALYSALWVQDRDLNDNETLLEILMDCGFGAGSGSEADTMLARTKDPAVKQMLIDNTAEAVSKGVFGAPTCIVGSGEDSALFWGQDRLDLVERAAAGWRPQHG